MRTASIALLSFALLPWSAAAQTQEAWPEYTEAQRWARMGQLGALGTVAALAYAKEHGATLEEFGLWWGDLFAPSWGQARSRGPVEVMTGMRRNFLSWPEAQVEIVNESDASVSARVNRPWVAYFGANGTWYGVSLQEFETLNSMFMRRVAEHHGLAFDERRDGEDLVITFSRR